MSDYGDLETGHEHGGDVEYGNFQTGQESAGLDQLQQASGSEQDFDSQYGVYAEDHSQAESTDYQTGKSVEYEGADGSRYESTDYTNYSNDSESSDSVFAAQGSESAHTAEFSELDALQSRFENNFAEGTQFSVEGHGEGAGPAITSH